MQVSNTFYFTFTLDSNATEPGFIARKVLPETEEEARRVLERYDADREEQESKGIVENNIVKQ